jgi:Amt family ammonium transporter
MSDFSLADICGEDVARDNSTEIPWLGATCVISDRLDNIDDGLNVFFLLFAGALVFLMQAGFAMLCAGSVRQKNVKNIMLKNLLDACGGAIGFWSIGFAFAYDNNSGAEINFIGTENFFLRDFSTGADYIGFFFQFAFAATAATIVAGTVAERCKMSAYLCYSIFLTGFVYPVVVRSIWSGSGFLTAFRDDPFRGVGMVDFAGSGVVHMVGGATALVAAIILGPRKGRFYDEDGNPLETPHTFPAHSVALQVLGTFVLWFGW